MDLVVGARTVIVTMTATSSNGEPKLVPECTLPLTAREVADIVVTELAVFRLPQDVLTLTELLGDTTLEDVAAAVSAPYAVALEA
jgi:3-oxoacid CoA-transferase